MRDSRLTVHCPNEQHSQQSKLFQFSLNVTNLAYREEFLKHVFGTAMSSPVSVTVANMVMESVEERALSTYQSPVPFWKRYMDNTVTALRKECVKAFYSHRNTIKVSIQFTIEETDNTLPFLPTHHKDGSMTTVFCKSMHTVHCSVLCITPHHKVFVARTLPY